MMVKITDEMVERAMRAFWHVDELPSESVVPQSLRKTARVALNAAMNPPAEPEPEVTVDMIEAGISKEAEIGRGNMRLASIYRAMYAARPMPKWASSPLPDLYAIDTSEKPGMHLHRRKGDK